MGCFCPAHHGPFHPFQVVELVKEGYFTGMLFYRMIPGFLAQFGVPADPVAFRRWSSKRLVDEPNLVPFERGTLSFAGIVKG